MITFSFSRILGVVFLVASLAIFGCGGGGGGSAASPSAATSSNQAVANSFEISPEVKALIDKRYSSAPDLRRAAEGFASADLTIWKDAVKTGVFNSVLSLREAYAQICLSARSKRMGVSFKKPEITEFLTALTSTPEVFKAYLLSDHLSSGHPIEVSFDETTACRKAGIQ